MSRMTLIIIFLISLFLIPTSFGVSGNSSFFLLTPNCTTNQSSFLNCSQQTVNLNCYIQSFQFVNFAVYNFNSTSYLANQLPNPFQNNWTVVTTLNQKNATGKFIYNWSSVVITDTANNIAFFPQNILINHSCPDCFSNIVNINSSCGTNDIKNVTYTDLSNCTGVPIPPNTTTSCNFCDSNWQCTNFTTCTPSTKYKFCQAVTELAGCFNTTLLASDNFTGFFSDYTSLCNFNDFQTNTTLLSTLKTTLFINQYPYVERNTTVNVEVLVTLADVPLQISNVQMQLANTTLVFNYDALSQRYKKSFMITELGDFPFVITGRENSTQVFVIDGLFYVRDFISVNVQLFEDRNQSRRYTNNLAQVIALKNDETFNSKLTQDLLVQAENYKKLDIVLKKSIKLNLSTYYNYDIRRRAFHTPYINGVANLRIPVEATSNWEIRLLNMEKNNEYIFDDFNYASIRTIDSIKSNDVLLANGKILANIDIKILVSQWDVRFWSQFTKWAILLGVLLIFVIAGVIVYSTTQDSGLVVKLIIAVITVLPTLYIILKFILG